MQKRLQKVACYMSWITFDKSSKCPSYLEKWQIQIFCPQVLCRWFVLTVCCIHFKFFQLPNKYIPNLQWLPCTCLQFWQEHFLVEFVDLLNVSKDDMFLVVQFLGNLWTSTVKFVQVSLNDALQVSDIILLCCDELRHNLFSFLQYIWVTVNSICILQR